MALAQQDNILWYLITTAWGHFLPHRSSLADFQVLQVNSQPTFHLLPPQLMASRTSLWPPPNPFLCNGWSKSAIRACGLRQTLFTQHLQALQISDSYREADTELPLLKKKKKYQRSDIKAALQSITVNIKKMKEGIHTNEKDQIHPSPHLWIRKSRL